MQTILYSNKKVGKARRYKVRWVKEFPDEWLTCDKVPKELRDMYETRNRNRKEGQKKINSSSDKASEVKLVGIQRNKVNEHIISKFHRTFSCCLTFGYHLFSYVDNSHTHLFHKMRYNNSFCASHNTYLSNFDFLVCFLSSLGCKT